MKHKNICRSWDAKCLFKKLQAKRKKKVGVETIREGSAPTEG